MTCRSCGATIADKAIVCYRCGTPTADPATLTPRRPPPPGAPRWMLRAAVLLILLALVARVVPLTPDPSVNLWLNVIPLVLAFALALVIIVKRRR
jgi:hypothetical protein